MTGEIRLSRPARVAGDGFYRDVAEQYELRAERSKRPAALLAEEAGVPTVTVHRWVREARRRGFLPVTRQGATAAIHRKAIRVAEALDVPVESLIAALREHSDGELRVGRG